MNLLFTGGEKIAEIVKVQNRQHGTNFYFCIY